MPCLCLTVGGTLYTYPEVGDSSPSSWAVPKSRIDGPSPAMASSCTPSMTCEEWKRWELGSGPRPEASTLLLTYPIRAFFLGQMPWRK